MFILATLQLFSEKQNLILQFGNLRNIPTNFYSANRLPNLIEKGSGCMHVVEQFSSRIKVILFMRGIASTSL